MKVVNRSGNTIGYKCKVSLSAGVTEIPGNIYKHMIDAPSFTGYGIQARLHVERHYGTLVFYDNPVWHIRSLNDNVELFTVAGLECELNITVSPVNISEFVEIELQGTVSEPEWVGLPNSGLPKAEAEVTYSHGSGYVCKCNGYTYSGGISGPNLIIAYDADRATSAGSPISGGVCKGEAIYSGDSQWEGSYTYSISGQNIGLAGSGVATFTGGSISIEGSALDGTHLSINSGISQHPIRYKYSLVDRLGGNIDSCQFRDRNGKTWTGADSDWYEWKGVQTIYAGGAFTTGNVSVADPPFDQAGKWLINDPAPAKAGGITCLNPQVVNDYAINVTEEGETVTYRPNRVQLWVPLGDGGTLEGDMAISTPNVQIDDFASGWTVSEGTATKRFVRQMYTGESGTLTEAQLVPHFWFGNLVELSGTNLTQFVSLEIGDYKYYPVVASASTIIWDLTYPANKEGRDEADVLFSEMRVEDYEQYGQDGYYIKDKAGTAKLYGPTRFTNITISGLESDATLTSLTSKHTEADMYYHFASEFKQVQECGHNLIEGAEHPIFRNRYGIIANSGRWLEIPCNQEDITPLGYVSWHFSTISEIEGTNGGRLIFPRDDWQAVRVAAVYRSVGGANRPVGDMLSEAAYIGWISNTEAGPKIKPCADEINLTYLYNCDFQELTGYIDLSAGWQGEASTDSATQLEIGGQITNDAVQYLLTNQQTGADLKLRVRGDVRIQENDLDAIPGYLHRFAIRCLQVFGKILRNSAGKILHNSADKILRGKFTEGG